LRIFYVETQYFASPGREIAFKKWQTKLPDSDGFETLGVRNLLPSLPISAERVVDPLASGKDRVSQLYERH